jgi:hypothetical protein
VTAKSGIIHQAIVESLKNLTRALDRKIGKRRSKRNVKLEIPIEAEEILETV